MTNLKQIYPLQLVYSTVQYNTVQYSTVPPNPQSWWCGEGGEGEGGGEEKVHLKTHGSTSGDRG